jgi:hypothetical protein
VPPPACTFLPPPTSTTSLLRDPTTLNLYHQLVSSKLPFLHQQISSIFHYSNDLHNNPILISINPFIAFASYPLVKRKLEVTSLHQRFTHFPSVPRPLSSIGRCFHLQVRSFISSFMDNTLDPFFPLVTIVTTFTPQTSNPFPVTIVTPSSHTSYILHIKLLSLHCLLHLLREHLWNLDICRASRPCSSLLFTFRSKW